MGKVIILNGSRPVIEKLASIMCDYAQAAYPKGGTECSQSAHEALVTAAERLSDSYDDQHQTAQLNKRQRAVVKAAIQFHAQQLEESEGCIASAREACLLNMLAGKKVDEAMYINAGRQDHAHDG